MACDILFSTAWQCGDKDYPVQWHQSNYWIDGDQYTVDTYGDGDHDTIDASDLPSSEEVEKSWREYSAHVKATGEDPLGNFLIKHSRKTMQRWQFKVARSILGVVLTGARRAGRDYSADELPAHVVQYLNLGPHSRALNDFKTWQEFHAALPEVKAGCWFVQRIEFNAPRDPGVIVKELRLAARRHLLQKRT